jgi:multiple sugar transport system permease protein
MAICFVVPIWWLIVAATKSTGSLFSSPAFWFDNPASFFRDIQGLFEHQGNAGAGGEQVWSLITSGAFISVLPLLLSFLFLQRYWQGGLAIGGVTA